MAKKTTGKREHKAGKTHGFGYETDGESYWIAPCYTDTIDNINDERNGIAQLIAALNEDFTRRQAALSTRSRKWWADVLADLGLNIEDGWTYSRGRIFKEPKQTKDGK